MEKHDLQAFVQSIQNKVSIAVAVAVIQSKPTNLSIREYVEQLQERVLQSWMERQETSVFDNKILEFQQEKIFNQITDLLLPLPSPFDITNSQDLIEIPDVCSDYIWDDIKCVGSSESDTDCDGTTAIQNNITFVEAMVQLKFAVESSKALPVDQIHSIIQGRPYNLKDKVLGGEMVPCHPPQYSEDSGFGESNSVLPTTSTTIPASIFRFVTHSGKTDALLVRCLGSLLATARDRILTRPKEEFTNWRGSVLEHLTSVLRSVAYSPICTRALTDFVMTILDSIWASDHTGQLGIWEYQIGMLGEFCCNQYIMESVINNIVVKLEVLCSKLLDEDVYRSDKLVELYLIEKAPLFVGMLSGLVSAWLQGERVAAGSRKEVGIVTGVTELWKRKSGPRAGEEGASLPPSVDRRWREVCERLVTSSTDLFPLISLQAWQLVEMLTDLNM